MRAGSSRAPWRLLVVVLGLATRLQAAERMTPGQWEYTMTTKGESHVSKSCVTKEVAAVANGDARSGREAAERNSAKSHCKVTDFTVDGNTQTYSLSCGDRTIKSTSTYHGDRYEGVLKTKTASEETLTEVKARRLGACP
jgi:Protein of unknown function (DUF3617)